jgi:hypothetical protein
LAPHKISVGWINHIYPVARRVEGLRRAAAARGGRHDENPGLEK